MTPEQADKKSAYMRAYYATHRARLLASAKSWYWANKEKALTRLRPSALYARTHWWVERVEMFWNTQAGKCAICETPMQRANEAGVGKRTMCCDHNHLTGHPRALLCGNCNKGLGHFEDDPGLLERAADYLRRWRS
jgi:hypothetical protein